MVLVGSDLKELRRACHKEWIDTMWCAPAAETDWLAFVIRNLNEQRASRLQTLLQHDYDLQVFQTPHLKEAHKIAKDRLGFEK